MTRSDYIENISARCLDHRHRVLIEQSMQQHIRNGRGFWPAVVMDGEWQVVRFASARVAGRWTAETGSIDVIPVHRISPADLPRVHFLH